MTDLISWFQSYSPPVAVLLVLTAIITFVLKHFTEKAIDGRLNHYEDRLKAYLERRSRFEEKVLGDKYSLITGLSARLEQVMTNLNRHRSGQVLPDGFFQRGSKGDELVPLTGVFEDLVIHRLTLGETFCELLRAKAQLALYAANIEHDDDDSWQAVGQAWEESHQAIRAAVEESFGITRIVWRSRQSS